MKWETCAAAVCLAFLSGCNVDFPFDPTGNTARFDEFIRGLQNEFADAAADPLGAKPFPVLIGGNEAHVFYATNLTDIRIRFPGPTNDVVLPGFIGPSNVYRYDVAAKRRELIQPLVPASSSSPFAGVATDGRFIAYAEISREFLPIPVKIVADFLSGGNRTVVFDAEENEAILLSPRPVVSDGRLAFTYRDLATGVERLRIVDLLEIEPDIEIEAANFQNFDLRGDRLVYSSITDDHEARFVLRDLSRDEEVVLNEQSSRVPGEIHLADNTVVWTDARATDTGRVFAYDIPTGITRLWVDGIVGELAGATDAFLLTEETVHRLPQEPNKIVIRKYDADGKMKQLASFRDDGLAGQTRVIGSYAAWVNPERRVVLAPLGGGDRIAFRPF